MLKFNLIVSTEYRGGFKLMVTADDEKSQALASELTKLLIEKIILEQRLKSLENEENR